MNTALVMSSIGLAIVTVFLAWFTALLWREAKAARQPRVVASLDYIGAPNYAELRVVNAGAGAAIDIDITFDPEGGEKRRWTEPVIMPGEGVNFKLLSRADESEHPDARNDLGGFIEVFGALNVRGTYSDVRDQPYTIAQKVDVDALWSGSKRSVRLAAYRGPLLPFYQQLEGLKEALQTIASRP